jgi:hypothetical protein
VRSGTSENRKNTEFVSILEMGLREAYLGRVVANPAYEAMWLPIVGSFIAIKVGGGENDQSPWVFEGFQY